MTGGARIVACSSPDVQAALELHDESGMGLGTRLAAARDAARRQVEATAAASPPTPIGEVAVRRRAPSPPGPQCEDPSCRVLRPLKRSRSACRSAFSAATACGLTAPVAAARASFGSRSCRRYQACSSARASRVLSFAVVATRIPSLLAKFSAAPSAADVLVQPEDASSGRSAASPRRAGPSVQPGRPPGHAPRPLSPRKLAYAATSPCRSAAAASSAHAPWTGSSSGEVRRRRSSNRRCRCANAVRVRRDTGDGATEHPQSVRPGASRSTRRRWSRSSPAAASSSVSEKNVRTTARGGASCASSRGTSPRRPARTKSATGDASAAERRDGARSL